MVGLHYGTKHTKIKNKTEIEKSLIMLKSVEILLKIDYEYVSISVPFRFLIFRTVSSFSCLLGLNLTISKDELNSFCNIFY